MAGYGHHVYSSWINRQGGAGRGVPRRGKAEKGRGAQPRGVRGRVRGHVAGGTRRLSCCWPSVRPGPGRTAAGGLWGGGPQGAEVGAQCCVLGLSMGQWDSQRME